MQLLLMPRVLALVLRASYGPRCWYPLNRLEVVAWDQPVLAVGPVYFGLPPPIVLVAENGKYVPLVESEFLGDGCLIHVHGACWRRDVVSQTKFGAAVEGC